MYIALFVYICTCIPTHIAAQSEPFGLGGVQMTKQQQCKVQKNGDEKALMVHAICTEQIKSDYTLNCQFVKAKDAKKGDDESDYLSSVQCPAGTVMFDCSSFLQDRIDECTFSITQNIDSLIGEYYFWQQTETNKGKVYCRAVGSSAKVRSQATCCNFE